MPIILMYLMGGFIAAAAVSAEYRAGAISDRYFIISMLIAFVFWFPLLWAAVVLFFVYLAAYPILVIGDNIYLYTKRRKERK